MKFTDRRKDEQTDRQIESHRTKRDQYRESSLEFFCSCELKYPKVREPQFLQIFFDMVWMYRLWDCWMHLVSKKRKMCGCIANFDYLRICFYCVIMRCFAVTNGSTPTPIDLQNHWHVSFPNMIRKFDVISSGLGQTVDVWNIK